MDPCSRNRVEIQGQRRDKGFTFTGSHLGNPALVQRNSAHHLNIEDPHTKRPLSGLTNNSKCLRKKRIERFTCFMTRLKFLALALDILITQCCKAAFKRTDSIDDLFQSFYFTRIFCAEYLAEELSNHKVLTNICGRIKVIIGDLRARWRRFVNELGRIN